ncbi:MAG TPA: hypothetical protein VNH46_08670, partial [Gemmatimonadales bacterium]|nr:hypothetical protein [Gemmatimonadales bacterium]
MATAKKAKPGPKRKAATKAATGTTRKKATEAAPATGNGAGDGDALVVVESPTKARSIGRYL